MTLTQTLPVREDRRKGVASTSGIVATITLPLSLGPVLGPPVGGIILSALSRHWLFLVNVPLGLVAVVLALRFLPSEDGTCSGADVLRLMGPCRNEHPSAKDAMFYIRTDAALASLEVGQSRIRA